MNAVDSSFAGGIDYARLIKLCDAPEPVSNECGYRSAACNGYEILNINGETNIDQVSTVCVERQNLTMRMGMRRFARLTNGFSNKVENLAHAVSLHHLNHNYARPHQTLTRDDGGYKNAPAKL